MGEAVERGLSDEIWTLMTECWSRHPSDRPAMRDVVRELDIQEDGSLADGRSSNIFDIDVLSPPASVVMVPPLFSELARIVSALESGENNEPREGNFKEAMKMIEKAEEGVFRNFRYLMVACIL